MLLSPHQCLQTPFHFMMSTTTFIDEDVPSQSVTLKTWIVCKDQVCPILNERGSCDETQLCKLQKDQNE